ncbi:HAMP domain-containing histidine kinase [Maribacter sp. MMG018]|uniref:sensor histidine kinase n=1 Tax=Maribacter sp. MMG018 TaxID=2822688 RepID=UPI001B37E114|nr:HAMP domain-containing sensor histidine kinase [Maribacter sp. MMG018]MBQ4912856.1 HAMP domain-containing histidine kinase [Maribacter sp. MMG018]
MPKFIEKVENLLSKPYRIVFVSVLFSLFLFLLSACFIEVANFTYGFTLALVMPIIISYPISKIVYGYTQKIKKQKQELAKLDNINKKLFTLISHDIRSPIATLQSLVYSMAFNDFDKKTEKEYLGKLSKHIANLDIFLTDLLQWSQDQIQNKPVNFTLFKCNDILTQIGGLFEGLLLEKQIDFTIGDLDSTIYADQQNYAFIVRNVLHNAIKFTPKNGKIHICLKVRGDEVHTIIKDSGVGLSKEEIDTIFEGEKLFTQLGTSDEKGTGFGLKACIDYLKKNNGRLAIESTPGKGTKISIILPRSSPKD